MQWASSSGGGGCHTCLAYGHAKAVKDVLEVILGLFPLV